ncbi:DegT/DnrJ/EryC1/StrS family aminotransferase [Orbus mooreae]|uniref:DegT/DnrJ/EryC1/StrS family aminotransferase n=1 Tax=Orbus mooreae TaxID=3074107 RepID=UPI00370D3FD5
MAIFKYHENPPTAGLPIIWQDWFAKNENLAQRISIMFNLPPLELTCSGTIALVAALNTLKKLYPKRQQVVIPAYTCPLVALAIHHCGLKIVLCDLAKDSFEFDLKQLSELMSEDVLAVIPTHLGGRVADVQQVKNLAIVYQITVIEDAAQALGANVGTTGDIVFFSLAVGKGLTLYEGGLVSATDPILRQKLAETISTIPKSLIWEFRRLIELFGYTALYNPVGLHFVYGKGRRHALNHNKLIEAVGDDFDFNLPYHQVSYFRQKIAANATKRLPDFLLLTRKQALRRIEQLQMIPTIKIITDGQNYIGTWPFLMVLLPNKIARDRILKQLWKGPLGVSRLFIYSLPHYHYLTQVVPQKVMPNAEDFAERMLTITNSLYLTDAEFDLILQTISQAIQ